jgi:hypothetical protein
MACAIAPRITGYAARMNPFSSLHDLPRLLRRPAVRDLAWTLTAPTLLSQAPWAQRHPLQGSDWAQTPERLGDWLRALDEDDSVLIDALATSSNHRLGVYYERLWQFALRQAPGVELLAANLPIRVDGHTLGEMDALLRDRDGVHHVELAVKFYLGRDDASGESTAHWVGPGRADRLDRKLLHLASHQLPLSNQPAARRRLQSLGLHAPQPWLWLGGYLFYPWHAHGEAPAGANPDHLRGAWLHRCQWPALAANTRGHWQPLPKAQWLAPARCLTKELWSLDTLHHWLEDLPSDAHPELLVCMTPQGEFAHETQRLFLVGDDWPGSA